MASDPARINKAIDLIHDSRKIIVFTGAGISTNCGIPDFRSENGLYAIVKERYKLPYPEAVFDIGYFMQNPGPFFDLSRELASDTIYPSLAHKLVAWLEERGQIALVVTQNIDMLHTRAGSKRVIECHGSPATGHCMKCRKSYVYADFEAEIKNGSVPRCECGGVIKPDVVFFGEQLPKAFYSAYRNPPDSDLLIIMGTSLAVEPAASFALSVSRRTKTILVNRDPTIYDELFEHVFHMDTDEFAKLYRERIESNAQ